MEQMPQQVPIQEQVAPPTTSSENTLETIKQKPGRKVLRAPNLRALLAAGIVGIAGVAAHDDAHAQSTNWSNPPIVAGSNGWGQSANAQSLGNVLRAAVVNGAINQVIAPTGVQVVGNTPDGQRVYGYNPQLAMTKAPVVTPEAAEVLRTNAFDFKFEGQRRYIVGTIPGDPAAYNFGPATTKIIIEKAGDHAVKMVVGSFQNNREVFQEIVFGRDEQGKFFQKVLM